jgi:phage baseplate assembly protein W
MASKAFLGRGISFPFNFNAVGKTGHSLTVGVSENYQHIHESIWQILGTYIGERVMLPEFGSKLKELLFEGNNAVLKSLARTYVIQALKRWEKRIIVKDAQMVATEDANLLNIYITYTIIADQVEGNYVYPFYLGQES